MHVHTYICIKKIVVAFFYYTNLHIESVFTFNVNSKCDRIKQKKKGKKLFLMNIYV